MNPQDERTDNPTGTPREPADDPRQAIESGEPAIEGRQPGRPDDEETNVEGTGTDPDRKRGTGREQQDWESGRQQAL